MTLPPWLLDAGGTELSFMGRKPASGAPHYNTYDRKKFSFVELSFLRAARNGDTEALEGTNRWKTDTYKPTLPGVAGRLRSHPTLLRALLADLLNDGGKHLVNIKTDLGWTPLHFAAYHGFKEAVRCLNILLCLPSTNTPPPLCR
jgi:hypothetical protein